MSTLWLIHMAVSGGPAEPEPPVDVDPVIGLEDSTALGLEDDTQLGTEDQT